MDLLQECTPATKTNMTDRCVTAGGRRTHPLTLCCVGAQGGTIGRNMWVLGSVLMLLVGGGGAAVCYWTHRRGPSAAATASPVATKPQPSHAADMSRKGTTRSAGATQPKVRPNPDPQPTPYRLSKQRWGLTQSTRSTDLQRGAVLAQSAQAAAAVTRERRAQRRVSGSSSGGRTVVQNWMGDAHWCEDVVHPRRPVEGTIV